VVFELFLILMCSLKAIGEYFAMNMLSPRSESGAQMEGDWRFKYRFGTCAIRIICPLDYSHLLGEKAYVD